MAHGRLAISERAAPVWARVERVAAAIDAATGATIEALAALLVVAEVLILLCGVYARYVIDDALIWSDELASMLFIWLDILGAAIAFRRCEHMAMTVLRHRASPERRLWLETASLIGRSCFSS